MGAPGTAFAPPRGRLEAVYGSARESAFRPAWQDNARVLGRLVAGSRADLWHFFFAPNRASSSAGAVAARIRRTPTVHTVCSAPRDPRSARSVLFADRTVVLSRATERALAAELGPSHRLTRIPPGIEPLSPPSDGERALGRDRHGLPSGAPLVLYPGDLEFGGGAALTLEAFARLRRRDALVVMACRAKTRDARLEETRLRQRAEALGLSSRVRWIGQTPHIHALVGACDVVALPSTDLYAKMDYPLVLLEAMSLARPVMVASGTPAAELAEGDAVRAVTPDADALAELMEQWLTSGSTRDAQGARARRLLLERYTRGAMGAAYERLYDDLLGR
jgi:glycosyltransferase involved in cell wall biosynthesis